MSNPDPKAPSANPARRLPKITDRALHLLKEVALGNDRIYAADARPPGAQALMQRGYLVRLGNERAEITATGRAFLAGYDLAYEQIATTLKAG